MEYTYPGTRGYQDKRTFPKGNKSSSEALQVIRAAFKSNYICTCKYINKRDGSNLCKQLGVVLGLSTSHDTVMMTEPIKIESINLKASSESHVDVHVSETYT